MQPANHPTFQPTALPQQSLSLLQIVSAPLIRLRAWAALTRSRKGLGRLDAHLLRDIGIDALTAQEQATRPFWRS